MRIDGTEAGAGMEDMQQGGGSEKPTWGRNLMVYVRSASNETESVERQLERIESVTRARNWHASAGLIARAASPQRGVFIDVPCSGLTPVETRPAGAALLDWCAQHPQPAGAPGTVVIADWARLGRSPTILLDFLRHAETFGWDVRTCAELESRDDGATLAGKQADMRRLVAEVMSRYSDGIVGRGLGR